MQNHWVAAVIAISILCCSAAGAQYPDSAYDEMQARIVAALDGWTGNQSVWNFIDLLAENSTTCYPFAGVIEGESCFFGKHAVEVAIGYRNACNYTDIQQHSYWITKTPTRSAGAWQYTTSEGYVLPSGLCILQYSGNVLWELDDSNPKLLSKWLEMPDSTRIERNSACLKDRHPKKWLR
jgi:hypothetical protein